MGSDDLRQLSYTSEDSEVANSLSDDIHANDSSDCSSYDNASTQAGTFGNLSDNPDSSELMTLLVYLDAIGRGKGLSVVRTIIRETD